jgi:hypothetical protein
MPKAMAVSTTTQNQRLRVTGSRCGVLLMLSPREALARTWPCMWAARASLGFSSSRSR